MGWSYGVPRRDGVGKGLPTPRTHPTKMTKNWVQNMGWVGCPPHALFLLRFAALTRNTKWQQIHSPNFQKN